MLNIRTHICGTYADPFYDTHGSYTAQGIHMFAQRFAQFQNRYNINTHINLIFKQYFIEPLGVYIYNNNNLAFGNV